MNLGLLDYWVLEELVLAKCYIEGFYCSQIFTDFCRVKNKKEATVLEELLDRLVCGGLIAIVDDSGAASVNARSITQVFNESGIGGNQRQFCAMLTSAGSDAWESWAEPDWDRYIKDIWSDSFQLNEGVTLELVEVTASNKQRIEGFSQAIRFMNRGDAFLGTSIGLESPWDTTYWKTLSKGFNQRIIVVVDLHQDSWSDRESNRDHYTAFRQWYKRGFGTFAKMKMKLDGF